MTNLAALTARIGHDRDKISQAKYETIHNEVVKLQNELTGILVHLKTELSNIKSKNPDAETFDISDHFDTILDFQEIHQRMRTELGKDVDHLFGRDEHEASKTVSKADLEKLLDHISNCTDDNKHQVQLQTNKLFTEANLALAVFDALNKILKSVLQSQERRAQTLVRG